MRITKRQIRRIIKEEMVLQEASIGQIKAFAYGALTDSIHQQIYDFGVQCAPDNYDRCPLEAKIFAGALRAIADKMEAQASKAE